MSITQQTNTICNMADEQRQKRARIENPLDERVKHLQLTLLGMDTRQLRNQRQAAQDRAPTHSVHLLQPNGREKWERLLNEDHRLNFGLRQCDTVHLLAVDARFVERLNDVCLASMKRRKNEHTWVIRNLCPSCEVLHNGQPISTNFRFDSETVVNSGDEITVFGTTFRVECW